MARVAVDPAEAVAGGTVRVQVTVRNKGKRAVKPTRTRFYVSRDARWQKKDPAVATIRTMRLKAGKSAKATRTLRLPENLAPGTYRIIACADVTRRVRESNEKNNCRMAKRALVVKRPAVIAPPPPVKPPPAGGPLDVGYTTEPSRAVVSTLTNHQITTTGSNGTTYELTIPSGALPSPTRITMTPVASIGDYPFSSLVGAVEIQPHGLQLLKPARLVITPAETVAKPTGFLFGESGHDFHRYPLTPGGGITMDLMHFSTAGVGTATQPQLDFVGSRPPSGAQSTFEAAAAEVGGERRHGWSRSGRRHLRRRREA